VVSPLKQPIVIHDRTNETLARFHADCFESYFYSANKYDELAETAAWIELVSRHFSRW
jgi:hypothetical protein